ncbi:hypothetical protein BH23ACT6_BH23ACT6_07760 [soil metagenome]
MREVFEETGYRVEARQVVATNHFTVSRTGQRRPFRSQQFILAATITGGKLGTTDTGGTTDFARWVPIADLPDLEPRADIVDLARNAMS